MLPLLYSFRRCPYAIRARLALKYAGVQVALREIVLKDKPPEMLAASAKGTVPVLITREENEPEEVIDESLDIMLWALAQHDPDGWLDCDLQAASALIDANDEQFKPWLDRYKYPNRYDDLEPDEPQQQCDAFMSYLNGHLAPHGFLLGTKPCIADMAIYSFVRQYAFVDIDAFRAGPHAAVITWLDSFLDSELFQSVMHKYPPWRAGETEPVFPESVA